MGNAVIARFVRKVVNFLSVSAARAPICDNARASSTRQSSTPAAQPPASHQARVARSSAPTSGPGATPSASTSRPASGNTGRGSRARRAR